MNLKRFSRLAANSAWSTSLGPSSTAPMLLRISKSGPKVHGEQKANISATIRGCATRGEPRPSRLFGLRLDCFPLSYQFCFFGFRRVTVPRGVHFNDLFQYQPLARGAGVGSLVEPLPGTQQQRFRLLKTAFLNQNASELCFAVENAGVVTWKDLLTALQCGAKQSFTFLKFPAFGEKIAQICFNCSHIRLIRSPNALSDLKSLPKHRLRFIQFAFVPQKGSHVIQADGYVGMLIAFQTPHGRKRVASILLS